MNKAVLAEEDRIRWHFIAPIRIQSPKRGSPFSEGGAPLDRTLGYVVLDVDKGSLRALLYVLAPFNIAVWLVLTLAILRWARKVYEIDRQKSLFLATVTHEMRTPLNAIRGNAQMLLETVRVYEELPDAAKIETILASSDQLSALIENILTAQRLDAGKMELAMAPTDLREVVREAVDTVMPSIVANANRLTQAVDAEGEVEIDRLKVLQILMNLLSNAAKFTQDGHITLTVRQVPGRLSLQVADTGPGIPGDQQARIFEWFRKVDTTDAARYQGSGLGLAITKGFCEMLGGTISVESEVDVGSTFTVDIPLPVTSRQGR